MGYEKMNKKDFQNGCFSPNWIEIDLEEANKVLDSSAVWYEEKGADRSEAEPDSTAYNKEVRLESKRRKDLNTLLRELDEIKLSIQKAAEKQHRLANLMMNYTSNFAQ